MIPEKIKVEILTPFNEIYSEEVSAVRLPGADGYLGVFPGHAPLIAALKIGEIKIEQNGQTQYFTTTGGIAEILPDSVSILSETSEPASAIDVKRAQEAKERATKRIQEGRKSWDVERAQAAMMRAVNRLNIAQRS